MADRLALIRQRDRRQKRKLGIAVYPTPEEVSEIRDRLIAGESIETLAWEYGLSEARVRRCRLNDWNDQAAGPEKRRRRAS